MPPKTMSKAAGGRGNVYLFVPNIIGYFRIIFAFVSYYYAYSNWQLMVFFYLLSQLLDAFDGWAARLLGQSSRFGAVLDMVTDRFSTNIVLAILAHLYVEYSMVFWSLAILDYVSHWAQMYSTLLTGMESHKTMNITNPLIRLYYTNKPVLFCVCAAQELTYLGLYVFHFVPAVGSLTYFNVIDVHTAVWWILAVSAPVCAFKNLVNLLQLKMATDSMNEWEAANEANAKNSGGSSPKRGSSPSSAGSKGKTK